MIKLRGHHILCIEGFIGHGYSTQFVENMKKIISELERNPDILLLNSSDDICSCCPNLCEGRCMNENGGEDDVKKMDSQFYKKTGLCVGKVYKYSNIKNIIYNVFKNKSDLNGICNICSWNRICKWYLSRAD